VLGAGTVVGVVSIRQDRTSRVAVWSAVLPTLRHRRAVHRRWRSKPWTFPDEVSDELGACLGIPGITAHTEPCSPTGLSRPDGSGAWSTWGVASLAAELARWRGAIVIGTERRSADLDLLWLGRQDGLPGKFW
jgi:NADPH:quinone reductase-like Zn-dependent oxidoreductase